MHTPEQGIISSTLKRAHHRQYHPFPVRKLSGVVLKLLNMPE